jgi:hypothetical protein
MNAGGLKVECRTLEKIRTPSSKKLTLSCKRTQSIPVSSQRKIRRQLFPADNKGESNLKWISKQQDKIFKDFCNRYNLDAEGNPVKKD